MTREEALLGLIKFAEFLNNEVSGRRTNRKEWIAPMIGIGAAEDFCEAVLVLSRPAEVQAQNIGVQTARNAVVSIVYSKRAGGMVDSSKLRVALDNYAAAVRAECQPNSLGALPESGESRT